jgi:predicted lipoprotein with Yx(FWY)xxD motif
MDRRENRETSMKRIVLASALALATALTAPAAFADTAIATMMIGNQKLLVDGKGMTLYTFDKDSAGVSNCEGTCAEKWPPLMATDGAKAQGKFGIINRPGGIYAGKQWTYDGMPLYTWVADTKPGDTTGDGVGGVWHVVPLSN